MTREQERLTRAQQAPIVDGLAEVPGIGTAMRLTPAFGVHLRGLADQLLVNDFPGATITRGEREVLATAVSAANDCFFCMDSHAAHATAVVELTGQVELLPLLDGVKTGSSNGFDPKMQALLNISRTVGRNSLELTAADVEAAKAAGASDGDVQLAVAIAAGFSMYNRLVDGFRAYTPPSTEVYMERARDIAAHGYSGPPGAPPMPADPRSGPN
jgi:uncharacterized peroxidase-related enzyme